MKAYKIKIVVEVEKKFVGKNEMDVDAEKMSDDIQAYLVSIKHAIDTPWEDCTSITIKAHS